MFEALPQLMNYVLCFSHDYEADRLRRFQFPAGA